MSDEQRPAEGQETAEGVDAESVPVQHDQQDEQPDQPDQDQPAGGTVPDEQGTQVEDRVAELEALVAERTSDLQRLQAEYVNYKRRVDRDRELARQGGVERVVLDLLPVMDSIEMARSHDELVGGFKLVAEEIEKLGGKYGLEAFGAVGDPFDPSVHEALMHLPMEGVEVTTCSQVMQRGYTLHGKVLRPARVAVADPQ